VSIAAPNSVSLPKPAPRPSPSRKAAVVVGLLVLGLVAVVGYRAVASSSAERVELPVLSTVPAFDFVDQFGQSLGSRELTGQVWVANFIFTRCPNICPKFTAKMGAIVERSAELPVKFVSFTVDPEHDTPEVLKQYGETHHADFTRWSFARGTRPDLERVIKHGMLQPMEAGDGVDLNTVVHGSYFALVDAQLHVRGVYRFTEPNAADEVVRDAKILLAR
jgi:protein SCO1